MYAYEPLSALKVPFVLLYKVARAREGGLLVRKNIVGSLTVTRHLWL